MKLMYSSFAFLSLFVSTGFIFSNSSSIDFSKNSLSQANFVLQDTSKNKVTVLDVPPQFEGGMDKFYEYVSKSLNYPKEARKEGIEGKVLIQFVVDKDGSLINVEIEQSVHTLLDTEAVRVVQESPKWIPAFHKGKVVKVRMHIPIVFKLDEVKKEESEEIEVK